MAIQELFAYGFKMDPSFLGMPKDRFGSFILRNFGAPGLARALIASSPCTRFLIIIGLSKPCEKAVVRDGEVVVEKVVTMV